MTLICTAGVQRCTRSCNTVSNDVEGLLERPRNIAVRTTSYNRHAQICFGRGLTVPRSVTWRAMVPFWLGPFSERLAFDTQIFSDKATFDVLCAVSAV